MSKQQKNKEPKRTTPATNAVPALHRVIVLLALAFVCSTSSSCGKDVNSSTLDATMGGQIGQNGTDTQGVCDSVYTVIEPDALTELGNTPDDIWSWLGGEHSATLTWADNEAVSLIIEIAQYGDAHQTCVSQQANENDSGADMLAGALEAAAQEPIEAGNCGSNVYESFDADSDPKCQEQLIIKDVMLTLRTDDGALDESYVGYWTFQDAATGTIDFALPPTLNGALDAKTRFGLNAVSSFSVVVSITAEGTTGRIVAADDISNPPQALITDETRIQTEEEALAMDLALANSETVDTGENDVEESETASGYKDGEGPDGTGREIATWE